MSQTSRILFFQKGQNFAYQNIPISPKYHMVIEEDHKIYPKVSILPNSIVTPSPPPGTGLDTTLGSVKFGAMALFKKSLDRTNILRNPNDIDKSMTLTLGKRTTTDFLGTTSISQFTNTSTERFSKVNSKYERLREPVNMLNMLSRDEQKTYFSLETQLPKNPQQKALDQFGYTKHNPELDHNIQELKEKISPHRADKCVIGFDRVLPRDYRKSIYS